MTDNTVHDIIIVGAGPSALTAAVYTTREDFDTVLYEKAAVGGLMAITDMVDNYPGFPEGATGLELASQFEKQANRFGAKIEFGEVSGIRLDGENKIVTVDGKDEKAKAVLIATGSDWKKIGVPGEKEYYARGVHYCATCDGAFYRDKKLVVVGGGNSAIQEALFLTKFASHIDLLVRSTIKASDVMNHELQKHVDSGKVTVHLHTTTDEIVAEDSKVIGVKGKTDGEEKFFASDGVFIFVGLKPNTEFLAGGMIELDELGLIKTNEHLETNIKGVFASGDVRSGATRQVASAVGEGAAVAISIREYLDALKHQS